MKDQIRYIGFDKNGIRRVFGSGTWVQEAYDNCLEAIKEYVARRPDTGPVSSWKVKAEKWS